MDALVNIPAEGYTRPSMPDSQAPGEKPRLVEGNKLRCPHCKVLGDPLYHFKPLALNPEFAHELFVIQSHRKDRGGCGHVFAPGEPWIIGLYLAGELTPKAVLDEAKATIEEQRQRIEELLTQPKTTSMTRGG